MRVVFAIAVVVSTPARAGAACTDVDDKPVTVATAATADEYALTVNLQSASATSWGEAGNEALVLEVIGAHRGMIGHLIVHQGHAKFPYAMHVGALVAGEQVQLKISALSASKATHRATACVATLVGVSTLGAAGEGVRNAPEFRWPIQKAFDDVPLVVGWSRSHKSYTTVMTNENGGTAEICGGGASGMQAELARWGRSTDIEDHWHYGGKPHFERCTGSGETAVRMEDAHPILYEGSGHNRLFESRGGYGQACGSRKPDKPDGDLDGWNVHNPGNSLADDAGHVIILRPLPVDLDALGYAEFTGRREALSDHYAPWMYRLSALELAREHKIDNAKTFAMDRYLYLDVRIANVGGEGDSYCTKLVHGGFKIRVTTKKGDKFASPQMTKKYAGGEHNWKRIAIAMPAGVTASDIEHLAFDAFDKDGMYLTAVGDAFVAKPEGDNGATLDYVRTGTMVRSDYVDDDRSGCKAGVNHAGPGGTAYTCVGSLAEFK